MKKYFIIKFAYILIIKFTYILIIKVTYILIIKVTYILIRKVTYILLIKFIYILIIKCMYFNYKIYCICICYCPGAVNPVLISSHQDEARRQKMILWRFSGAPDFIVRILRPTPDNQKNGSGVQLLSQIMT